jgi:hypothetical protein
MRILHPTSAPFGGDSTRCRAFCFYFGDLALHFLGNSCKFRSNGALGCEYRTNGTVDCPTCQHVWVASAQAAPRAAAEKAMLHLGRASLACAPVFEKSVRNYRAKKRTAAVATLGDGAVESGTARMQGKSDTDFDANLANLRKYQVGVSPGVVSSSLPMSLAMDHPDRPLLRWLGRLCTKHRENHLAQWKGEALRSGGSTLTISGQGTPK